MANRRLEILLAVLKQHETGGSYSDLLWNMLVPPCTVMGKRLIEKLEEGPDNTTAVSIKGYPSPLFFPKEFGLIGVYHVLTEIEYSRNWHFYTTPETPVERDDVVFDCGSAEGLFMLFARKLGATGVAFEPHPNYLRGLRQTFGRDKGVIVVDSALSDKIESGFLLDSAYGSRVIADDHDSKSMRIKIETMDAVCGRLKCYPTYLKVDIEGYEQKMLEGAAETISSSRPKIAITTYHAENNVGAISKLLKRYCVDYQIRVKGISNRYGKPVMLHAWT
jgi:FkbM family methyltransferase